MTDRDEQALRAYLRHRYADQFAYYESRADEYATAHGQALMASTMLLLAAGACGVLGAADIWAFRAGWGVLAVAFAGAAAFITGYDALLGYEPIGGLYQNTADRLYALRAIEPDPSTADPQQVAAYVTAVESVLSQEHVRWEELVDDPPDRA
ncbi:SLATT domain-containing protein [Catenuloplanes japonicus]|uniref:SLATT domain-containing protein n=1 Tax=Catenuloplanes japonicus TaxID=33876 RepID=UPI0005265A4A|nr:SLATT domain-containing protein [Catenuloplanes japonicus]